MKELRTLVVAAALLLGAPCAWAQEDQGAPQAKFRPRSGRFTYGGSLGFGIGSLSWGVSLRGEAGYLVTDRFWTGVSGRFQLTHYEGNGEYYDSYDSVDWGVGVYARYFVLDRLFAATEWDWTSYELGTTGSAGGRDSFSSVLVGAGYGQPVGPKSLLLVEVLFDLTGNVQGVYDTPWVTRLSFATGF